jgi:hypothetical protein
MANVLDTMTWGTWENLPEWQKNSLRDYNSLTPQLTGLEGMRVEVVTDYDETRRFIVGKSTGWKPIHLEIAQRNSSGGGGAERHYKSVRVLYRAR